MEIVTYIMIAFAVLGAIDRLIGNKFGLGEEFEKGIKLMGVMTLTMTGMLVLAPTLVHLLSGAKYVFPGELDFSIIPSIFIANDMGASVLADGLAKSPEVGLFSGLIVSSMLGATISFSLPYAMEVADKRHHKNILFGFLCGIVTVPVGCFVGGLMVGVPVLSLLLNMIPLVVVGGLIAFFLVKFPNGTTKVFKWFGYFMKVVITLGLVVGIVQFLTKTEIIPYSKDFMEAMEVVINASCVMAGAFPLLFIIKKLIKKPMGALGKKIGINEVSAFGFLATMGSFVHACKDYDEMDEKGVVLVSAFSVSGAFTLVGHLAYTLAINPSCVPAVIVSKIISAVTSVILAIILYKRRKI